MLYRLLCCFNPERRFALWVACILIYGCTQAVLYGQTPTNGQASGTPWEHLSLEGALALAVSVQYRENRAKEQTAKELATEYREALTKVMGMVGDLVQAVDRLSGRIDRHQSRSSDSDRP